jgi:hypothetical protein
MKTHDGKIYELTQNQIFVFGSNEAGRHGAGAARRARMMWGAKIGQGVGLAGNTYAIPSKNKEIKVLPIGKIKKYVNEFIEFVKANPQLEFMLTDVGCGLAGFHASQIAPLFKEAKDLENITWPPTFVGELLKEN